MNQENRETILVVDDSPENLAIAVGTLQNNYKVKTAKDGNSAFRIALNTPKPSLILLDVLMPDIDGYETIQMLKNNAETAGIPVIFVTSLNEIKDKTRGFELGAVDYISKPFEIPELLARVKTHIELKNARDRLEIQNRELIEAARLKEDVERITRHDLKGPLNAIIGLPQLLLLDENLTVDQRESVEIIMNSGRKMLNMINLSLDLFKMERGIYNPDIESIEVLKIINEVKSELRELIKSKNIDLSINIIDNLSVSAEDLLMYSLYSNLIKNAVEATPSKTDIKIYSEINESKIVIFIENFGEVPENIRNTFFDKYSTSGKSGGTGLGTYSAKLIAKTLGGDILLNTEKKGKTIISVIHNK